MWDGAKQLDKERHTLCDLTNQSGALRIDVEADDKYRIQMMGYGRQEKVTKVDYQPTAPRTCGFGIEFHQLRELQLAQVECYISEALSLTTRVYFDFDCIPSALICNATDSPPGELGKPFYAYLGKVYLECPSSQLKGEMYSIHKDFGYDVYSLRGTSGKPARVPSELTGENHEVWFTFMPPSFHKGGFSGSWKLAIHENLRMFMDPLDEY